jgi:hypothetical protein
MLKRSGPEPGAGQAQGSRLKRQGPGVWRLEPLQGPWAVGRRTAANERACSLSLPAVQSPESKIPYLSRLKAQGYGS